MTRRHVVVPSPRKSKPCSNRRRRQGKCRRAWRGDVGFTPRVIRQAPSSPITEGIDPDCDDAELANLLRNLRYESFVAVHIHCSVPAVACAGPDDPHSALILPAALPVEKRAGHAVLNSRFGLVVRAIHAMGSVRHVDTEDEELTDREGHKFGFLQSGGDLTDLIGLRSELCSLGRVERFDRLLCHFFILVCR